MRHSLILLLAVMLAALTQSPPARANAAWALVDVEDGVLIPRAERRTIGRDLQRRLGVLQSVVPDQEDEARQRVEQRLASLDDLPLGSKKRGEVFLSLEYQHHQLLSALAEANRLLACVVREPREAREITCWAALAQVYLEESRIDLGLRMLRERRMVPRDDDMPRIAQDPRHWYSEFARGILRGIVTPYLAENAAAEGANTSGAAKADAESG